MRAILLASCILISALLVSKVNCEEDEDNVLSMWERLANAFNEFVRELRGVWGDFREEMKARTADFGSWTTNTWNEFKVRMKDWINRSGADDAEKDDMRNYIERLQMPEEK